MRICTISFHCCPYSLIGKDGVGGMNVYIREMSSSLIRRDDVEIDIFTRSHDRKLSGIKPIQPGLRVIHIPAGPQRPLSRLQHFPYIPEFSRRMEAFLNDQDFSYDVIYSHYWLSGLVGEWLKFRTGLPLIHIYHSLGFLQNQIRGNGEARIRMDAERRIALIADAIAASSDEGRDHLQNEYGLPDSRIHVIPPGVNSDIFYYQESDVFQVENNISPDDKILLFVGRVEPIKGLMTAAEALDKLRDRIPRLFGKLKVAVVGGGRRESDFERNKEMVRIRKYLASRRMENKFIWLGSKRQESLRAYYSASSAVVVPSLYESFGLVVLESQACGTPVLASRVGKMPDLITEGKSGFSFPAGDPAALAEKIVQLFDQQDEIWPRERIRSEIIEHYSWDSAGDRTHRIFVEAAAATDRATTILRPGESPQPA